MEKYIIQDRQCGNIIEQFDSLSEAQAALRLYENDDKKNGVFEPDFYEIQKVMIMEATNEKI